MVCDVHLHLGHDLSGIVTQDEKSLGDMMDLLQTGVQIVSFHLDCDGVERSNILLHEDGARIVAGGRDAVACRGARDSGGHTVQDLGEGDIGQGVVDLPVREDFVLVLPGDGEPELQSRQGEVRDVAVRIPVIDLLAGDGTFHTKGSDDAEGLEVEVKSLCSHIS